MNMGEIFSTSKSTFCADVCQKFCVIAVERRRLGVNCCCVITTITFFYLPAKDHVSV